MGDETLEFLLRCPLSMDVDDHRIVFSGSGNQYILDHQGKYCCGKDPECDGYRGTCLVRQAYVQKEKLRGEF